MITTDIQTCYNIYYLGSLNIKLYYFETMHVEKIHSLSIC